MICSLKKIEMKILYLNDMFTKKNRNEILYLIEMFNK